MVSKLLPPTTPTTTTTTLTVLGPDGFAAGKNLNYVNLVRFCAIAPGVEPPGDGGDLGGKRIAQRPFL